MTPDENHMGALWIPEVNVRKGLPLSTEFGMKMDTSATAVKCVWRMGSMQVVEGYQKSPDLAPPIGLQRLYR